MEGSGVLEIETEVCICLCSIAASLSVEPTVACITVCISSHGVPTAANNVVEPYDNEEDFDNIDQEHGGFACPMPILQAFKHLGETCHPQHT